jgi:DNA polymerase elongation subunit (family B)
MYDRSAIYAEFGKVVCVCVGIITGYPHQPQLRMKYFANDDEKQLLTEFADLLRVYFSTDKSFLCAHNGKEFDFPYLSRRMLIHGIKLPILLDNAGKKPWEIKHLDTMDMWKFGDYKHFTSLRLLTKILDIPSSKGDIDGSQVAKVYYVDKDIDRIVTYCEKDVIAVAQIFLRLRREDLLVEDEIIHI